MTPPAAWTTKDGRAQGHGYGPVDVTETEQRQPITLLISGTAKCGSLSTNPQTSTEHYTAWQLSQRYLNGEG